eukprot:718006_1
MPGRARGAYEETAVPVVAVPEMFTDDEDAELPFQTGEEAVDFFSSHGNSTPIKFVYANRAKTGDNFRPYDLMIVKRKETNAEFFTISASGVVHILPGSPSEFISLQTWGHESTMFNLLTSIPTFKFHLMVKMFKLWCANVRFNMYTQTRAKLARHLFAG